MGDHIAMYNVASKLYPPESERQPFLMVLNSGEGKRAARMYHMDVAPTILARMKLKSNVSFMAGQDRGSIHAEDTTLPDSPLAVEVLRQSLWNKNPELELCRDNRLIHWNGKSLEMDGWQIPVKLAGYRARKIPDSRSLLVFVGKRTAHAQLMLRGTEGKWVARAGADGHSVFKATPFWDDAGQRQLALDWIAPSGAWASFGQVGDGEAIQLVSPQCKATLASLDHAVPGQRLDFSEAFGLPGIAAAREPAPGIVRMRQLPADRSTEINTIFMFDNIVARRHAYGTIRINHLDRISMQPDNENSAWADFDVGYVTSLTVDPRIDPLLGSCKARSDTGTVGFSASLDGRTVVPRFILDRNYDKPITLDTRDAKTLRIMIDKGNDSMACDWFSVAFPQIVTRSTIPDSAL